MQRICYSGTARRGAVGARHRGNSGPRNALQWATPVQRRNRPAVAFVLRVSTGVLCGRRRDASNRFLTLSVNFTAFFFFTPPCPRWDVQVRLIGFETGGGVTLR